MGGLVERELTLASGKQTEKKLLLGGAADGWMVQAMFCVSAVIYMEGGSEKDLEALDMDEADLNSAASNKETESVDSKPKKAKKSKKRKKSEASGSSRDSTPNKKV